MELSCNTEINTKTTEKINLAEPNLSQQDKIISFIENNDVQVLSQREVRVGFDKRNDFFEQVNSGEVNDDDFKSVLLSIKSPMDYESDKQNPVNLYSQLESNNQIKGIVAYFTKKGFENRGSLRAGDLYTFFKQYPEPLTFESKSKAFIDLITKSNGKAKAEEYKTSMDYFQRNLYGKRYEYFEQIEILKQEAKSEQYEVHSIDIPIEVNDGLLSAEKYKDDNYLSGEIPNGFFDAGRYVEIDDVKNGNYENCSREILLVDRENDDNLRNLIESIKNKTENKTFEEKVLLISQEVFTVMGGRQDVDFANKGEYRKFKGRFLKIGDIGGKENPGVCRHRSLLFQVLASECGLSSAIVRGNGAAKDGRPMGGHAWNEVYDDNKFILVDTLNPPAYSNDRFSSMNVEEFNNTGGFPRGYVNNEGLRIMDFDGNRLFDYLSIKNETIYNQPVVASNT